jgi:hypothetical protein
MADEESRPGKRPFTLRTVNSFSSCSPSPASADYVLHCMIDKALAQEPSASRMPIAHETQDHVVQFYRTDAFLARVVATYMAANLRRRAPILLVCTFEHLSGILSALTAMGLDVAELRKEVKFVWLDARMMLQRLLVDGSINAAAFGVEIGDVVRRLCADADDGTLQVFGEIVDLLWAEGREADAIALEELLNSLASEQVFHLLCSYRVRSPGPEMSRLRAVCEAHSHVLRPETPVGIDVMDDTRGRRRRFGEGEMVRALLLRDQQVADGLRERVAQIAFGLMLKSQALKNHLPSATTEHLSDLTQGLGRLLQASLGLASEMAPVHLEASSLAEAVQRHAAMASTLFDVRCKVSVARTFRDPVRIQRELLFAIFREVLDRAAQERGALKIFIRLSRRGETQELAIYHDGDSVIAIGARDDALRRLVYQARAMGNQVEIRPRQRGRLQVICRW